MKLYLIDQLGNQTLKYTWDNIESFEITKDSGVTQFAYPWLESSDPDQKLIKAKCDLVRISGVEAKIRISWMIKISDIYTVQDLVSNIVGTSHKLEIDEWATDLPDKNVFKGLCGSITIRQEGGVTKRARADLTFLVGDNILKEI